MERRQELCVIRIARERIAMPDMRKVDAVQQGWQARCGRRDCPSRVRRSVLGKPLQIDAGFELGSYVFVGLGEKATSDGGELVLRGRASSFDGRRLPCENGDEVALFVGRW